MGKRLMKFQQALCIGFIKVVNAVYDSNMKPEFACIYRGSKHDHLYSKLIIQTILTVTACVDDELVQSVLQLSYPV